MSLQKILNIGTVLAIVLVFWLALADDKECRESGGKYVRGTFWFECINGDSSNE